MIRPPQCRIPAGPTRPLAAPAISPYVAPDSPPALTQATPPTATAPVTARHTTASIITKPLTAMTLSLWLLCAACSSSKPEAPAPDNAPGFAVGDGVKLDPKLVAYAASVPAISAEMGLTNLFTASTLRDPSAVRKTVIGIFKGIESAELGLLVTGIMLDRFAQADGYSADTKAAWGTMVSEGMDIVRQHVSETLRAVFQAVRVDMANPEIQVITLAGGRPYSCQSLPPPIEAHLTQLQAENLTAMTLYAAHVRWQLSNGAGKTPEARAILITGLLGSRTIVRGDLSGLLDRYRSPSYDLALRKAVANPLAEYAPGESPGMLDVYRNVTRSGWTHFWDNFSFLNGLSGLGGMLGMLVASGLLRRRRTRREKIRRESILGVVGEKRKAAAEHATVEAAMTDIDRAFELMDGLLNPSPDRFWSRARVRQRGEGLAFYIPIIAIGLFAGAAIQSIMEARAQRSVPLLVPDLQPTMVQQVGVDYAQADDLFGYPAEIKTLVEELTPKK